MGEETKIKIVMISQQGSGTNLLRAFLNSHPDIDFYDELFAENRTMETFDKTGKTVPAFLNNFFEEGDRRVMGFDLKYNQIMIDILEYIKKHNLKIIHLHRDPVRTFFKSMHSNKFLKHNQVFNQNNLEKYVGWVKEQRLAVKNELDGCDIIDINYEAMTRGDEIQKLNNEFQFDLLKWIGVDNHNLTIDDRHCYAGKVLEMKISPH